MSEVPMIENCEKLASPKRTFLFFRDNGFYTLDLPEATVSENAKCNPGTICVRDAMTMEIVWPNANDDGRQHKEPDYASR